MKDVLEDQETLVDAINRKQKEGKIPQKSYLK